MCDSTRRNEISCAHNGDEKNKRNRSLLETTNRGDSIFRQQAFKLCTYAFFWCENTTNTGKNYPTQSLVHIIKEEDFFTYARTSRQSPNMNGKNLNTLQINIFILVHLKNLVKNVNKFNLNVQKDQLLYMACLGTRSIQNIDLNPSKHFSILLENYSQKKKSVLKVCLC